MVLKKNQIEAIKWFSVSTVIALGGAILYSLTQPPTEPLTLSGIIPITFFLFFVFMGISFINHGFHPLLLVSSSSHSETKSTETVFEND